MNRWTIRLALAFIGDDFGNSGLIEIPWPLAPTWSAARDGFAKKPASESRPPRAIAPKPIPERQRSSRRVTTKSERGSGRWDIVPGSLRLSGSRSIHEVELVGQEQHLGELRLWGEAVLVGSSVVEERDGALTLTRFRRSAEHLSIHPMDVGLAG